MRAGKIGLVEVIALSICGVIGFSILSMGIVRQRALARGESCSQNLRQLGLSFHNYHDAFRQLPPGCGGTDSGSADEPLLGNASRLSPLVALLPFLEQQKLWQEISRPKRTAETVFPSMGPVPWYEAAAYTPWGQRPSLYVCPDDAASAQKHQTVASYAINYGDAIWRVGFPVNNSQHMRAVTRGMFSAEFLLRFRDVLDGLSNTLLISERRIAGSRVLKELDRALAKNPSLCVEAAKQAGVETWPDGRQASWADGVLRSMGFQTILPPNSPSCLSDRGLHDAIALASSYHEGGAFALICDGSVTFVTETIDTGDLTTPGVSVGDGYSPPRIDGPLWRLGGIWDQGFARSHYQAAGND